MEARNEKLSKSKSKT